MNILMIHPHDIYSQSEPWTIRIKRIAAEFIKKGHSVKLVYFPEDKKNAYKRDVENNIEIFSMNRIVSSFVFFRNIINIVKLAQECDIIHFQKCHYTASLPALIAAFICDKPIHYDWDDWETKIFYYSNPHQKFVGEFINMFEKLIPQVVDTVSVSSSYINDLCVKRGVNPENIFFAPVGADVRKSENNSHNNEKIREKYGVFNKLVLYVGQLHGGQYAELFVKAAHIVVESGFDATFMILGDGYRLSELKRLAVKLNIESRCIFPGAVKHKIVSEYILAADVCAACFEDNEITRCKSPLKIVEYLACGKPIVASNVGEVRNMVGGVGVLVEPGSSKLLAHGIMNLLKNDTLRENLSEWGKERISRKYNWEATANSIFKAYERGLKKNKVKL
ncbi:MAG: glycosyltransferase [Candidatus Omnitrophica bacterium]|nr:glycosyltransferase [Candidatus Omnitrophota bacterium]MCK5287434.1 glycosyltransferase [Candidatus Omnitrophota bacterium]MCK5492428.1 glycosyltransferase [Candidatus Omnitrophota bacterium]